jgi:hypothetical protein
MDAMLHWLWRNEIMLWMHAVIHLYSRATTGIGRLRRCGKLNGKAEGYETKDRPEGLGRSFAGLDGRTSTGGNVEVW